MSRNSENLLNAALSKVKYKNADLTKRDVMNVMVHYRGLVPKQDTFIFNDGVQRHLITLEGTIPVPYKGNNYNIPVSIWLLETHPFNAPVCYVKPTQAMQIKVSKHVDSNGKIYLPYLHEWNYPKSDLIGLIQICIVTFSEQPPVYSRKSDPTPPPPPSAALPYPTNPTGYPGYPPTSTPYPPVSHPSYHPQPPGTGPAGYRPGPVYPPVYPPASSQHQPVPGYPAPYPPGVHHQTPGYPPTSSAYPPPVHQNNVGGAVAAGGTITQEHIKASILSAVEDKVRRRIRDEFSTLQAEQDSLKKTGEDLTAGRERLTKMLTNLDSESKQLDNSIQTLEKKQTDLTEILSKHETSDEIDVDEAVMASAPLFRQLLNAYAEESATEDALYFLGEALRRGVVDIDSFLKQVRNLSRKQFMLRATMQKCRQKAGLSV